MQFDEHACHVARMHPRTRQKYLNAAALLLRGNSSRRFNSSSNAIERTMDTLDGFSFYVSSESGVIQEKISKIFSNFKFFRFFFLSFLVNLFEDFYIFFRACFFYFTRLFIYLLFFFITYKKSSNYFTILIFRKKRYAFKDKIFLHLLLLECSKINLFLSSVELNIQLLAKYFLCVICLFLFIRVSSSTVTLSYIFSSSTFFFNNCFLLLLLLLVSSPSLDLTRCFVHFYSCSFKVSR